MTVRRSLVATAVAVLACVPSTPALAAAASAQSGGAKAPVSAGPNSDATRAAAQLRAAVTADRAHHHTSAKKRQTGEFKSESTPLTTGSSTKKTTSTSGGGTSILRTIGGLLLVVGAIYGLAWVLRKVKRSRAEQASGRGLQSIATLPLGAGRTLHLVRAGTDVIVVGTSEHGVAPIARYTEEEALANGVLDGGQLDSARDPLASFMPDGSPQPPLGNGWRALEGGGAPGMLDVLRRLTVRS